MGGVHVMAAATTKFHRIAVQIQFVATDLDLAKSKFLHEHLTRGPVISTAASSVYRRGCSLSHFVAVQPAR
jgi:hypothetical protein